MRAPDNRGFYEKTMTCFLMLVAATIVVGILVILIVEVVSEIGGGSSP